MGSRHARVLGALGQSFETVDPVAPATYRTLGEVSGHYEAACVAVPIRDLARVAMQVIDTCSPRVVLVEKPGAASAEELVRLQDYARARDVRVLVGYTERHNPAFRAFRAQSFARVTHLCATRFSPDAALAPALPHEIDLAVHDLDLAWGLGFAPSRACWYGGYAPVRSRVLVCHHADGTANVLDLDHRMVNGEPVEGEEPLAREWRQVLAAEPGFVPLGREIAVLEAAEALAGVAA
jgi:hypothetical protein